MSDSPIADVTDRLKASEGRAAAHTHRSEPCGEIAVQGIPFSVVLADGGDVIVMASIDGDRTALDRYRKDGAYVGRIAVYGPDQLPAPAGVATDSSGSFYIPDAERDVILVCGADGQIQAELGDGEFKAPRDVDVGAGGEVLIADTDNHRIQVWSRAKEVLACWGAQPDEDDESRFLPSGRGPGDFFRPFGVTGDSRGRIWVADTNNHRVQRLSVQAGFEHMFGVEGDAAGQLRFPIDVRIDAAGRVVVVDQQGARIQWFDEQGACETAISALAGLPEGAVVADVDVDADGVVYIPVGPAGKIFKVRAGGRL
jgi:sugar lactone lactonase YvrE